jgi:hypothetical protein
MRRVTGGCPARYPVIDGSLTSGLHKVGLRIGRAAGWQGVIGQTLGFGKEPLLPPTSVTRRLTRGFRPKGEGSGRLPRNRRTLRSLSMVTGSDGVRGARTGVRPCPCGRERDPARLRNRGSKLNHAIIRFSLRTTVSPHRFSISPSVPSVKVPVVLSSSVALHRRTVSGSTPEVAGVPCRLFPPASTASHFLWSG